MKNSSNEFVKNSSAESAKNSPAESLVLILGGRSDIGQAIARHFARLGHPIALAARNADSLAPVQSDLEIRYGVAVSLHEMDAVAPATYQALLSSLPALPDIAVCVVGILGDQQEAEQDFSLAQNIIAANYTGPAALFSLLANRFAARGSGTLVGVSSVAGLRGRASNYIYGSAKAGFNVFLSGLRQRLAPAGVHVVTVLPGFVRTRMTAHLALPGLLTAAPNEVAHAVAAAVYNKRSVVYSRWLWRWIMLIIRLIPEPVFRKIKL